MIEAVLLVKEYFSFRSIDLWPKCLLKFFREIWSLDWYADIVNLTGLNSASPSCSSDQVLPKTCFFLATTLKSQLPLVPNPRLSEQSYIKGTQMARMIPRDGSAGAEGAPQVASQPALQKLRRPVCQVSPNVAVSQLPANTWRGNNSQRRQRLEELLASHQETLLGSRPSYANQL